MLVKKLVYLRNQHLYFCAFYEFDSSLYSRVITSLSKLQEPHPLDVANYNLISMMLELL